ncbi:MAG TPA: signal peptidase I [Acidimicrobiales bacterium]
MRSVPPPSGLPGDDQSDASANRAYRVPPRGADGPRHMAPSRRPRDRHRPPAADRDGPGHPDGALPPPGWPGAARRRSPLARLVAEWVLVIGCGVLIALGAQRYFVQAFWIPSPSMAPTLEVGDRVLVNKLSYKTHDVNRGDLVVFERPPQASTGADGEIEDLIKRVIAVGGDTIEGRDGQVYVNGERIEEPYLVAGTPTENLERQEIPGGHVFVMGDNRLNSEDSRVFGPIDEDTIVGRAFVKVLPLDDLGWL